MINVVLFEPEIPTNTGNIMRTCIATGIHLHLIKPLGFSLDDKYVRRSGVNYIDKCKYTLYDNIDEFFSKNKGEYFFFTRYGHKPHSSFNYTDKSKNYYFFFGKESTGIPPKILKPFIDRCARIPMTSNVRALNVSNAVAIVVYEALRQRDYDGLLFDEPHKDKDFIMLD
jgi:tRNA (cytidine/uridine-2'-O-)-methyltransferase